MTSNFLLTITLQAVLRTLGTALIVTCLISCVSQELGGGRVARDHPQAGLLTLPDGSTYAILPDQFAYSGQGKFTDPGGRTLEGDFVNGRLQGPGIEKSAKLFYEGEFRDGVKHGQGQLQRQDGSNYSGSFLNDLPHGKGEETNHQGTYTGQFVAGRYQGEGQFRYGEHAFYRGQWVAGKRQGFGQYNHVSGASFVGDWQSDTRHGFGKQKYAGGGEYEGAWRADKRVGYGTYKSPTGIVYEGIWANDQRQGFGAQTTPDGIRYEGEWQADRRHGTGRLSRLDGSFHEGTWAEDFILGPGVRQNANGLRISGVWNQDSVSHGLLTFPNGHEYAGPLFKQAGKQVTESLVAWAELPENSGDAHVQLFLASIYRDFAEPVADPQLSALWLSRAASSGLADAQFEMALAKLNTDASEAVNLLHQAAAQNHPDANARLGQLYHIGQHVSKDPGRAADHYKVAAAKGNVAATNNLAWLLATTNDDQVADPNQALQLIQPLVQYLGEWQHIDTFAAALARMGNFSRAKRMQTLALEQAAEVADDVTLAEMQARMTLYTQQSAYTE